MIGCGCDLGVGVSEVGDFGVLDIEGVVCGVVCDVG